MSNAKKDNFIIFLGFYHKNPCFHDANTGSCSNSAPISWLIAESIGVYPPLWRLSNSHHPSLAPGDFLRGGVCQGVGDAPVCAQLASCALILTNSKNIQRSQGGSCDKYLVKCVASIDEVWTLNGHKVFMARPEAVFSKIWRIFSVENSK